MNSHVAYFNSNSMQIKIKNNIYKITSNGIKNGEVILKSRFISDFLKEIKIKNIFNKKIVLILNKYVTEEDTLYYNSIFEDLNYSKIELISSSEYIKDLTLFIEDDEYKLFYKQKYYDLDFSLLNCFIENYKIKLLRVISEHNIKTIVNCRLYYYNNVNNYFFK